MIKPFLHERTRNKISIFSHEPKQWKAAILSDVNPEELPVCYGGTLTDPDGNPNCITMASYYIPLNVFTLSTVSNTQVNMGGEVPKSYYLSGKVDNKNKKPLEISRGSKELLEFQVQKAGDILS